MLFPRIMESGEQPVVDASDWNWWYRLVAVWVMTVLAYIGFACIFGPDRWFTSNSLQALHDSFPVPWPVYGGVFLACAVCIPFRPTRLYGYAAATVLSLWFVGLAVAFTLLPAKTTNPITIGFACLSPLMLLAGIRYAAVADHGRWRR